MRASVEVLEQGVASPRAAGVHVAQPEAAPPPTARPSRRTAVMVAHGMGQQVRFEIVDTVARALGRGAELAPARPVGADPAGLAHRGVPRRPLLALALRRGDALTTAGGTGE